MSDKSFGDHTNRTIVKNPLLSSAVTGLSIEDLTHNAVLLPAVPAQEMISRQDRQSGDQHCALGDTNRNLTQTGDASFKATLSDINAVDNHGANAIQYSNIHLLRSNKADDFDVNEYFARLQGTRYVSAPINSCLSENLQSEENLEEINLNDEKNPSADDTQHSITSDIAQNFSQLPTVLPQVASAVFSSFSNMLNYKSREQTPDEPRELFNAPPTQADNLMNVPEMHVAPPPLKEPPVTGIPNYRITTKKKVYAQIPGLSHDNQSTHTFPPTSLQAPPCPSYFIPDAHQEVLHQPEQTAPPIQNKEDNVENNNSSTSSRQFDHNITLKPPEIVNANDFNKPNVEDKGDLQQANQMQMPPFNTPSSQQTPNFEQMNQMQLPPYNTPPNQQTPVIPPPPMFSNLPRKDGQTFVEKTILPPSVARRITSNQPIMKQNPPPSMSMQDIFVPTVDEFSSPDNVVSFNQHPPVQNVPPPQGGKETYDSVTAFFQTIPSDQQNASVPVAKHTNEPQNPYVGNVTVSQFDIPSKIEETPTVLPDSNAPTFFNPINISGTDNVSKYGDHGAPPGKSIGVYFSNDTVNAPPKSVIEPPKISSSGNYRLTKKKPQYYAGPIEGVGSISNNVKPILNPVEPSAFQGSLFTPYIEEQNTDNIASNYPTANQAAAPFDINQTATVMYTPFDYNKQQERLPDINTAFDMSRPTTERFEQANDPKGFGIIGSLKSKLSSIDINKIQSTVTTFFDPAFNDTKIEKKTIPENLSQYQSVPQYSENERNLEIFVPTIDQAQTYTHPKNYQSSNVANTDYYYQSQGFTHNDPNSQLHGENNLMSTYYQSWYSNQPQGNVGNNAMTTETSYGDNSNQEKSNQTYGQQTISFYNIGDTNTSTDPVLPESKVESSYMTQENTGTSNVFESPKTQTDIFRNTIERPVDNIVQGFETSARNLSSTISSLNIKNNNEEHTLSNTIVSDILEQPTNGINIVQAQENNKKNKKTEQDKSIPSDICFSTSHQVTQLTCVDPSNIDADILAQKYNRDSLKTTIVGAPLSFVGCEKKEVKADMIAISTEHQLRPTDIFQSMPSLGINDFKDLCIPFSIDQSFGVIDSNTKNTSHKSEDKLNEPNVTNQPLLSYFRQTSDDISGSLFSQNIPPITSSLPVCNLHTNVGDKKTDGCLFHNSKKEISVEYLENQVSELNICETCREVNKAEIEDKEVEDLTSQLIENITAPFQLLNPVGGPLAIIDSEYSETPIPENIIENIKPVIELLEDDSPAPKYGWTAEDSYEPTALIEHTYTPQAEPNRLGNIFFHNQSLSLENIPKNASDEIKAEYQSTQEDYSTIMRQIGLPSAPSEEETKSDEGGLDVLSIEQDAKKDFPILEEFTIEPSETDDDKMDTIERTKSFEEPVEEPDSFTNRVARFKRMETSTDSAENMFDVQNTNPLSLPTSISPAITIASYFDTGNYAAETHYRNSLTSPITSSAFNFDAHASIGIPPGFEEEYKRRISAMNNSLLSGSIVPNVPFIPDTTTQTSVTTVLTTSRTTEPRQMYESQQKRTEEVKTETPHESERLPAFSNMIKSQNETKEPLTQEPLPLEDPISFFSTQETTEQPEAYNNFSRLSSYFTTPSKPDQSKSFFELSQSQNHYRHDKNENKSETIENNVKTFFENQNLTLTCTVPENIAQMSLVKDLRSTKYYSPKDVATTVGYFTVEYDNFTVENIGEPEILKRASGKTKELPNYDIGDIDIMVGNVENIIKKCKICCDITKGVTLPVDINTKDIKVKGCMDEPLNDPNMNGEDKMENKEEAKKTATVHFLDQSLNEEQNDEVSLMAKNRTTAEYVPVKYHWFYQVDNEDKCGWRGFSIADSMALENAYNDPQLNADTSVPTDGGRYDVNVVGRLRLAVYWQESPTNVIRCSWFYKGTTDGRYVPYPENIAELLEEEYRHGVRTGEWHRRLLLPNNVVVVMHGPTVMVHFQQSTAQDITAAADLSLGNPVYRNLPKVRLSQDQSPKIDHLVFMVHGAGEYRQRRPRTQSAVRTWVVRRGYDELEIDDTEPNNVDHLVLLCHGVGSACDMRFRPVEKVVDDFRLTSLQLIQSHYRNSYESGVVGRVEVLPISWHSKLHSGETGVDRRLAAVTLDSIPKLRNFTNDTILDVLFYTSPVFCQTIMDTVCGELNRIYQLFKSRNPNFNGGVSLGGHSLGSVILYDLLCHQLPVEVGMPQGKQYVAGAAGTGQPMIKYPSLDFQPDAMYALGSPIAIFECIRGVDVLGQDFHLPTCKNFFNIFHPYDPIAYRIEPMINPVLRDVKPILIPHHKGRKRMHLELKDTMARVGADIKQRLMETIKNTWSTVWKTTPPPSDQQLEKVVEEELEKEQLMDKPKEEKSCDIKQAAPEMLGQLNDGRRVDHVLQEAPFEMINEYLFAMRSHVCYWESEDTMLLILREIYDALGVRPDSSVPPGTMSVERTRTVSERARRRAEMRRDEGGD